MLRHLFFISAHKFVSTNEFSRFLRVTPSPLTSGSLELISAALCVCLLRYYKHYAFFLICHSGNIHSITSTHLLDKVFALISASVQICRAYEIALLHVVFCFPPSYHAALSKHSLSGSLDSLAGHVITFLGPSDFLTLRIVHTAVFYFTASCSRHWFLPFLLMCCCCDIGATMRATVAEKGLTYCTVLNNMWTNKTQSTWRVHVHSFENTSSSWWQKWAAITRRHSLWHKYVRKHKTIQENAANTKEGDVRPASTLVLNTPWIRLLSVTHAQEKLHAWLASTRCLSWRAMTD